MFRIVGLVFVIFSVVSNVDAGNPIRPFKGAGIGVTTVSRHPTLPEPYLLLQAVEKGNYTHFGRAVVITMSADFNPVQGTVENGRSVATAADGSTANAQWSAQGMPDGTTVLSVIWSGGTKRFVNFRGESMTISAPIDETSFKNIHSGKVSY